MTEPERRVLQRAIDEWGKENQTIVAIEELSELQKELTKTLRGYDRTDGLIEEMADVYIMLGQIKLMYDITDKDVLTVADAKLQRLSRIMKGVENY